MHVPTLLLITLWSTWKIGLEQWTFGKVVKELYQLLSKFQQKVSSLELDFGEQVRLDGDEGADTGADAGADAGAEAVVPQAEEECGGGGGAGGVEA
mgnify:CR=1 FL=1